MAKAAHRETWECKNCKTVNPLAKNTFQSTSCFMCGTKHAVVRNGSHKEYLAYFMQEKPVKETNTSGDTPQVRLTAE